MKDMGLHLKTAKFPVMDGEEEEMVNEGMYGKAISLHLQKSLTKLGYEVPFECSEDWGWWVEVKGFDFTLGLCVYCESNPPGEVAEYVVMSSVPAGKKWSWRRFKRMDTTQIVGKLIDDVEGVFQSDPEVELIGRVDAVPW